MILHAAGLDRRGAYTAFADSLAARGIDVLAYDVRGSGDSEGEPGLPTLRELTEDAQAALEFLRGQNDVDSRRLGLWALSRGGYVAPLVALADAHVRFLIVISSPGLPVSFSDSVALVERGERANLAESDLSRLERFVGVLFQAARHGGLDYAQLRVEFSQVKGEPWFSVFQMATLPPEDFWLRYGTSLTYDPDSVWRRVQIPTLLIYGARDEPRLVGDSRSRILAGLGAAGGPVVAPVYADADHFIQLANGAFAGGFFGTQQQWIYTRAR